jgi:cysteinyl-tRNA synthetase
VGKQKHTLLLYNTLTKKRERFEPKEENIVRIFTCGPSVYRTPHIGNYRTFLYEDILQRYLELLGYRVKRVINFTDVEDKAIQEAEEKGITLDRLTGPVIEQFHRDCERLHIKLPSSIPRSSTSVAEAAMVIKILLDKGVAYRHGRNIYFDPLKYPKFGELFGLDMARWPGKKVRFSKDTYNGLRWNLGDFILWHGYRDGDKVFWDTEIGRGRPAWNVQDAAMIYKEHGTRADICCGGIDNLYRHHDYNRAIMEAVSGGEFAHYWLHGEHVVYDGKKMSKSMGNVVYPQDFFNKGYSAEELRFFLISGHYRKRLNYTENNFGKAVALLKRLKNNIREVLAAAEERKGGAAVAEAKAKAGEVPAGGRARTANPAADGEPARDHFGEPGFLDLFHEYMNDDFQLKAFLREFDKKLMRLRADKDDLPRITAGLGRLSAGAMRKEIDSIDSVLQVGLSG